MFEALEPHSLGRNKCDKPCLLFAMFLPRVPVTLQQFFLYGAISAEFERGLFALTGPKLRLSLWVLDRRGPRTNKEEQRHSKEAGGAAFAAGSANHMPEKRRGKPSGLKLVRHEHNFPFFFFVQLLVSPFSHPPIFVWYSPHLPNKKLTRPLLARTCI